MKNNLMPEEERFEVRTKLGSGAMGTVYRAYDRDLDTEVALKVLRISSGVHLYRFKNEFRALTDIMHPNLVNLFDLQSVGDDWFFTMEFIDGCNFLDYVRPVQIPENALANEDTIPFDLFSDTSETLEQLSEEREIIDHPSKLQLLRMEAELQLQELRLTILQLIQGVHALHQAGMLHRDIKPSNVLIDQRGRLALCDFGLVATRSKKTLNRTIDDSFCSLHSTSTTSGQRIIGTPAYMAPEQIDPNATTPASDWYSVGIIIYEALTGRRPHSGTGRELFESKKSIVPTDPRQFNPKIPSDLAEMCMALLRSNPDERPSAEEIYQKVENKAKTPLPSRCLLRQQIGETFVGREDLLQKLHQAFADSREKGVTVLVSGQSGIGKTTLVSKFLEEVRNQHDAVVLQGRCSMSESVPYKALDSLIDDLSGHLVQLDPKQIEEIIPKGINALTALFPVLKAIESISAPQHLAFLPQDPQELKRRAVVAFRNLLGQLAQEPLVVSVDDIQWGDLDSVVFFKDLIYNPAAPPILLILNNRTGKTQNEFLKALFENDKTNVYVGDIRSVELQPLNQEESFTLARTLIGESGSKQSQNDIDWIVSESEGNPLFISEMILAPEHGQDQKSSHLDDILKARLKRLPEDAYQLLQTIAIAQRPILARLLVQATRISNAAYLLSRLRIERLIRIRQVGIHPEIEPYHNRISTCICSQLTSDVIRDTNRALALTLEKEDPLDPQALVFHWSQAGEEIKASQYAHQAALVANQAGAFGQAVEYYQLALTNPEITTEQELEIRESIGTALAHSGDMHKAAKVYLEAAQKTQEHKAIDLKRRALECMLISGRLEDGLNLAKVVMKDVGVYLPKTTVGSIFSVLTRRLMLKMGKYQFTARSAEDINPEELLRIDTIGAVSTGLTLSNPVIGIVLQQKQMSLALKTGEPNRIILCRALECGYRAMPGHAEFSQANAFYEETLALAQQRGSPESQGAIRAIGGFGCLMMGKFPLAKERLARGIKLIQDNNPTEMRYFLDSAHNYYLAAKVFLGELADVIEIVPQLLREALEQGDTYLANTLRFWRTNLTWLISGEPQTARTHATQAIKSLIESKRYHLQHYYALMALAQIDLYEQNTQAAWERIEKQWQPLHKSMLLRVQLVRMESFFLRARSALAISSHDKHNKNRLNDAEKSAANLEKNSPDYGIGMARLIQAIIAHRRSQPDKAKNLFTKAIDHFEADHTMCYANVARMRLGQILQGDEGKQLCQEALDWMKSQNIADPEAFTELYSPGFDTK